MATEMITLKLDSKFLKEIDSAVKTGNYHNRTEFIRQSLREKIEEARMKTAMKQIESLRGKFKDRHTSEEEYERVRQGVFNELDKRLG